MSSESQVPTVAAAAAAKDVTRRMVCGGVAGMIAKVSTVCKKE